MNKYELVKRIEEFAPIESAEKWDCVGFMVDTKRSEVKKILLCLTITQDIINKAHKHSCEMIISHHPLFYVPLEWSDIDIYSTHTNLDKANGGTTDTIISKLGLDSFKIPSEHEFLRFIKFPSPIEINEFSKQLLGISQNTRLVNNKDIKTLQTVAFCAGSGSEFINESMILGADCLVTGDLKFHTAIESEIVVYDIGHYEGEILILPILKNLIPEDVEVIFAQEKSPFINLNSLPRIIL